VEVHFSVQLESGEHSAPHLESHLCVKFKIPEVQAFKFSLQTDVNPEKKSKVRELLSGVLLQDSILAMLKAVQFIEFPEIHSPFKHFSWPLQNRLSWQSESL